MLDTIIKLLERLVVALELIAANSAKEEVVMTQADYQAELKHERADEVLKTEPKTMKDKPEEDDLADDEPEEKPKRKPRAAKPKAEPEPDLGKLREEISVMAKHIGSGDSDDCADELDDLMDEYDVRSVKKLKDEDVEKFHKELKTIVAKYYDIED